MRSNRTKLILISIITSILIVLALSIAFLIFNKPTTDEETETDIPPITSSDLQQYMPEYTVEEIDEILNKELTDEQIEFIDSIYSDDTIPDIAEITYEDEETGWELPDGWSKADGGGRPDGLPTDGSGGFEDIDSGSDVTVIG